MIAASNLLEKLDPALLRPGPLRPPDLRRAARPERAASRSSRCTRRTSRCADVDLELVARQTSGLTGADLANICNEAAIFAGREGRDDILTEDFNGALERVVAGMESRRVMNDHEKRVVAYHEAGHALCSRAAPVGREGPQDLDRPARARARLHAEPARGGPLPEVEGGADRLPRRAARRPRRGADRLRLGHDRRLRRPQEGQRDQPRDGRRVRHGQLDELAPARDRRLRDLRQHAPPRGRGAGRHHRRRLPPRPPADRRPTATCSRRWRRTLLEQEVLEREDIERIVGAQARRRRSSRRSPARRRSPRPSARQPAG